MEEVSSQSLAKINNVISESSRLWEEPVCKCQPIYIPDLYSRRQCLVAANGPVNGVEAAFEKNRSPSVMQLYTGS